jgi:hypothetical protein
VLAQAIAYWWLGAPTPATGYTYVQDRQPDYIVLGPMAHQVPLYSPELLAGHYSLVKSVGSYDLYARYPAALSNVGGNR